MGHVKDDIKGLIMNDKKIPNNLNDSCIHFTVRSASRALSRLYDSEIESHGITAAQFNILSAIDDSKNFTSANLAKRLNFHRTSLARICRPLQKNGFIEIDLKKKQDGRIVNYILTEKGQEKLREVYPIWQKINEEVSRIILLLPGMKIDGFKSHLQYLGKIDEKLIDK